MNQVIATLRVNIKSLAAESSIIKKECRKHQDEEIRNTLYLHRVKDVRKESRITQLTLAAVKGIPYKVVERNAKTEPDWKKVMAKVDRHAKFNSELKQRVSAWCTEASQNFI
jgi:hypothetical protein